ncbi:MAG: DUF1761 domain-containing protein [Chlamydiales bacterium]|nr:DUF1761 domain-containing protein [Chlamydiia bacterium]MCP5507881.1 DUF1761 domain-containing protein [Chlamydiales bacterium]
MFLFEVNFIAVVVAAVLNIVIGYFWYSPQVFGKMWADAHQYDVETLKSDVSSIVGAFIVGFVIAWVFGAVLHNYGVFDIWGAMCAGFWFWLGFVATSQFSGVIWAKKPLVAYFIDVGFFLASILVMGIVFGILT